MSAVSSFAVLVMRIAPGWPGAHGRSTAAAAQSHRENPRDFVPSGAKTNPLLLLQGEVMSSIVSRWPVSLRSTLEHSDIDNDGRVTVEAAERIFANARAAYLAESRALEGASLTSTLT